jgi:hypothetical protein
LITILLFQRHTLYFLARKIVAQKSEKIESGLAMLPDKFPAMLQTLPQSAASLQVVLGIDQLFILFFNRLLLVIHFHFSNTVGISLNFISFMSDQIQTFTHYLPCDRLCEKLSSFYSFRRPGHPN